MALRFGLIENLLTADPSDYMAVTLDNKTMGIDDIINRMISRGSTITKAGALATIEEFNLAVCDIVREGNYVNTELFSVYPSVAGVFNSSNEGFNRNKHAINLNLRAGRRLSEATRNLSVEKVEVVQARPTLQTLTDLKSGSVNESISIGQIASIKGSLLKINGDEDSDAGIFLIADDGKTTKVTRMVKNKPSELLFFVPDELIPGSYLLEVRTVLYKRKAISVGRLNHTLTVTA